MATDILQELLAPYRGALAGAEMNRQDPVYSTLFPQAGFTTDRTEREGVPNAPGGGGDIVSMVRRMAANRGWTGDQWDALYELVSRESGWDPAADNPTSTAYGLFQFLDSTRENYGIGLGASPKKQARAGLRYVEDRYGNPLDALQFHTANNWY